MHLGVLVPTRNRPETARRAVETFLDALAATGLCDDSTVVIADDSDNKEAARALDRLLFPVRERHTFAKIEVLARPAATRHAGMFRGPGAVRNRALSRLRAISAGTDMTIMFDDDIAFADVTYRGRTLTCNGPRLLGGALEACRLPKTVVGCNYLGRQDLSILEHLRMDVETRSGSATIAPAQERGETDNVAPGGISTAFLALAGDAAALPYFPEHYNEDYIWLYGLLRDGWRLKRLSEMVVHAPPGDVRLAPEALEFQVFGEIVWLAVLERARYPLDQPTAIAAAVEEIVGDLRAAAAEQRAKGRLVMLEPILECLRRYEGIGKRIADGVPCDDGKAMLAAIAAGLGRAVVSPSDGLSVNASLG